MPPVIRFWCVCFLSAFVSACAPRFSHQSYAFRQASLRQVTHWQLVGAIRVVSNHHQLETARLRWQQYGPHALDLHVSGPAGLMSAVFVERPTGIRFRDGKTTLHANHLSTLMQSQLGWSVPADAFYYWVRGLVAPAMGQASQRIDAYGHLIALRQGAWSLTLGRYTHVGVVDLPQDIRAAGPHVQFHLVITQWKLSSPRQAGVDEADLQLLKSVR